MNSLIGNSIDDPIVLEEVDILDLDIQANEDIASMLLQDRVCIDAMPLNLIHFDQFIFAKGPLENIEFRRVNLIQES